MKKKIIFALLSALVLGVGLTSFTQKHANAAALDPKGSACEALGAASGAIGDCTNPGGPDVSNTLQLGINVFSVIVGVAAIVMIIVGGLKYITSQGESSNTASAKNTILYAIVGLVVVALAQIIVTFVLKKTVDPCPKGKTVNSAGVCS